MKSLSSSSINEILNKWPELKSSVASLFGDIDFPVQFEGVCGSLISFIISEISKSSHVRVLQAAQYNNSRKLSVSDTVKVFSSDMIIITPTEREADELKNDLSSVFPKAEVFLLKSFGTMPYRSPGKGAAVFGERVGVLSKLIRKKENLNFKETSRIFIMTQNVFMSHLVPPEYIRSNSFELSVGDSLDTVKIAERLNEIGYTRVPRVMIKGEFSLRGEVLDIFLPSEEYPFRIIFDFDKIEAIKQFETDAQITVNENKKYNSVLIYPMKEVIWSEELIEVVRQKLDDYERNAIGSEDCLSLEKSDIKIHLSFSEKAVEEKNRILTELELYGQSEGEDSFYNLLWDRDYSIIDYIDPSSFVLFTDYDRMLNACLTIEREYTAMYRKVRNEFPVLPPDMILNDFNATVSRVQKSIQFRTLIKQNSSEDVDKSEHSIIKNTRVFLECNPGRSFFGNINYLKEEFSKLYEDGWNIFVYGDNENQALRLHEILKDFSDKDNKDQLKVKIIPERITAGFSIPEIKLLVVQENEIFGRRKYVPSKSGVKAKSKAIDTFVELTPGDYVVHVNWGIGLFHGIERVKSMGNERDYIKLEYADEEFAFVPIEQVNLVQRYIGNEGDKPRLDRIGSKSWENRKNRVKQAVEELAEKLIALYSRRQASVGFAFPHESEWQAAFEAAFPYEDTPDQITVTEEIKQDMERPLPMDRLVCGDVGYGKTEIAMRAAFKAVMAGKQVAFLVPTTILAEQHYETCIERFKNFPVKIAHMSRFVSPQEQKKTLLNLSLGGVDILIGTHRIIQKDVKFKNLGLMIIDEEQRFGVKDKERLKEVKTNVDCLTMSATPIPRTLHMSLLKIRDMSLLTTPPHNRQPIETVVDGYSEDKVALAIRREMERGGQIFYLHNRVESLQDVRHKLEQIVPECLIDVAHGQMSSEELDDIFHRFKMGAFHVLIATTIIENGIDIPNVNTIIIDRADMYGVSQLYQLRGRVGRSDRKAYAYLLYPENKALSEVAMKRLQVISDFTELGSGFKIAMKDMEIRGAGNLLGRDQSGEVYAVGFDLYMRLLNDAVNKLTAQKEFDESVDEVLMEMEYTGFIPDSYVTVPQVKMEIYKKIASVQTNKEFEAVLSELDDRFGPIPEEVSSLLALAEIRIICRQLKIASIKERHGEIAVEFGRVSDISVDKILKLISENPKNVRLNSATPNFIFIKLGAIGLKEKSEFIREKLSKLL
ncbi:MAG: transcription-repair coupling factor [Treponema sp.]|nr:transcription-repair coupling factor [Treponema sp.]